MVQQQAVMQAEFGKGMNLFKGTVELPTTAAKPKPKKKKPIKEKKEPKKEKPSSIGDKAGNFLVKKLNKGIKSGIGAVGVG